MRPVKCQDITSPEFPGLETLVNKIVSLVSKAKDGVMVHINNTLVLTNWHIGEYIVKYEQSGNARATYGDSLLRNLSKVLTL